jgi:hypothetical protein
MRVIDESRVLWVWRKTDKGTYRQKPRYTLKYKIYAKSNGEAHGHTQGQAVNR